MKITYNNFLETIDKVDWSKVPAKLQEAKSEMNEFHELYNDDDTIKETFDLFLKQLNEVLAKADVKKSAPKKAVAKPKKVLDKKPVRNVSKTVTKKQSSTEKPKKPKFKVGNKVKYIGGEGSNKETWYAEIKKVIPLDNEFAYRVDAFNVADATWKDSEKTNEKYEVSLTLISEKEYNKKLGAAAFRIQKPKAPTKKESPCDDAIENFLENQKEVKEKAAAKRKRNKVKDALDKESVSYYNAEFRLLRRFYNLVSKKTKTSFRSVQLLYMAFQKHSVARKVRKTSELAHLYNISNKKLTKLYESIAPEKQDVNITFSDKDVLEQLAKLVTNKKVDYAISLMNRVINVQGTAPEDKKVTRLIASIENAFKNGRVDERSRLYDDLVKAKKELQRYVDDKIKKIPTTNYGLSGVKKKIEPVVVVLDVPKPKPIEVFLEIPTPNNIAEIPVNYIEVKPGLKAVENEPVAPSPIINKVEKVVNDVVKNVKKANIKKNGNVLSTDDIMNMSFDTLDFTGKWYDFMQSPAKNMRIAFKGKPKNGKTSGCMALAHILTDYGNVLYNFADQGINKSTQDLWKLSGLSQKQNAFISATRELKELDKLCASGNYDFVFIDMINTYIHRTGIKYFEFEDQFLKKYPNISFILVFEATKSGDFKGDQGWTHLVDAIVNVEDYVLHNNGRYGVGDYVVWEEGLKRKNPKKYKEFFGEEQSEPTEVILEV